jgi:tRNA-specific adenosine deaminase 1
MDRKEIDLVAQTVIDKYKRLTKSQDKTIIAGVVLKQNNTFSCIAVGSGQKTLTKSQLTDKGLKVVDSHAEIICKRSFQRYLLNQCKLKDSKIIESIGNRFRLREGVEFIFYCSQAPCGDASMIQLAHSQSDASKATFIKGKRKYGVIEDNDATEKEIQIRERKNVGDQSNLLTLLLGREDYDSIGNPRTKPCRLDCENSYSMSCSDKLLKWQNLGIGSFVVFLLGFVRFKYYIIGDAFHDCIEKSIMERVADTPKIPVYHTTVIFEFSLCSTEQISGQKSFSSLSYSFPEKPEIIIKGLKQGAKTATIKTCPNISKMKIGLLFKEILTEVDGSIDTSHMTYYDLKAINYKYQEAKRVLYTKIAWIVSSENDQFEFL